MIIITGGAGFIGSNLLASLSAIPDLNQRIVVCDRLGGGEKWQNLKNHKVYDIIHPNDLMTYLDNNVAHVQTIFHMGAISSTVERDADLVIATNVTYSRQLFSWCAQHQKRFIYSSSAATYGDGSLGFDDTDDIEHIEKLRPLNVYGYSKLLFDRYVLTQVKRGLPVPPQWAGMRFFNVYGPNEEHKESQMSLVWQLYHQINRGEIPRLFKSYNPEYPDGGQMRDFVWVQDCVDIMLWLHDNPKVSGCFNAGSGKARSFEDLAKAVFAAMNKTANIKYIDMPPGLAEKYQYFTEASLDKLKGLGWQGKTTSLEDGVSQYVQNYLMHEDPYR